MPDGEFEAFPSDLDMELMDTTASKRLPSGRRSAGTIKSKLLIPVLSLIGVATIGGMVVIGAKLANSLNGPDERAVAVDSSAKDDPKTKMPKDDPTTKMPDSISPDPPAKAMLFWEVPTDEECRRFTDAMSQALADEKNDAVNDAVKELVDWDYIVSQAIQNIGLPEYRRTFIKSTRARHFATTINSTMIGDGTYQLVRIREIDGEKQAVYRLLGGDGGFNYHIYKLGRLPNGDVKAHDVYVALAGEGLIERMRRNYRLVMQESRSKEDEFRDVKDLRSHLEEIFDTSMPDGLKGRESELARLNGLPDYLRKSKLFMIRRVILASHVNDQAYCSAVDEFRRLFPDDPALHLMSIGEQMCRRKCDEAMASVQGLDTSVGGDPFLNIARSEIEIVRGDLNTAKRYAEQAAAEVPDLLQPYRHLLIISFQEKNYVDTLKWLNAMKKQFGDADIGDIRFTQEWRAFTESPQYHAWKDPVTVAKQSQWRKYVSKKIGFELMYVGEIEETPGGVNISVYDGGYFRVSCFESSEPTQRELREISPITLRGKQIRTRRDTVVAGFPAFEYTYEDTGIGTTWRGKTVQTYAYGTEYTLSWRAPASLDPLYDVDRLFSSFQPFEKSPDFLLKPGIPVVVFNVNVFDGRGTPTEGAVRVLRRMSWANTAQIFHDRREREIIVVARGGEVDTEKAVKALTRAGFEITSAEYFPDGRSE